MNFKRLLVMMVACVLLFWGGMASSPPPGPTVEQREATSSVAPAQRPLDPPGNARVHRVPYRISETLHLIVRAKLNGKGPFNFIVDTGAPAMFVRTAVAKEAEAGDDPDGWTTFDRMELEGGALILNAKARAEDIFQIRGMNSLRLPGVRLDGVLGYNILARFRMEFDLSKSYMTWTELDFDPPLPTPLGKGGAPPELEAIGKLAEIFATFVRAPEPAPLGTRGSLGIALTERDGAVHIDTVLANSPADVSGLKPGDTITAFAGARVRSAAELLAQAATVAANEEVRIHVNRRDESFEITVTTRKGF